MGQITPHPDIEKIEKGTKKIWFKDGKCKEFDIIICATGKNVNPS
jgi:hypothetical protein